MSIPLIPMHPLKHPRPVTIHPEVFYFTIIVPPKKNPGKGPQTVWGGKGIRHYKCHDNGEVHEDNQADDDDDDDDDDDEDEDDDDDDDGDSDDGNDEDKDAEEDDEDGDGDDDMMR